MKKTIRKILILLFSIFIFPLSSIRINADEDDETTMLTATFYAVTVQADRALQVPFNRKWFLNDAREYSHDLAKLSLGLTVSAFRPSLDYSDPSRTSDSGAVSFLTQAGFTDLQSDDYDKNPNIYTVSTVMGHETITEGDESFELIAVGVCGQGYRDEWESNFSIGSGTIHDGFERSANQIYNRIFGYIASHHLSGKMKIWISGFSRAAAVSNITAARLTESDTFSEETVFAYTFGTPRTTKEPMPGKYENIKNIVGKMDPVPSTPFADWGFDRYGITYFTPELETDSDYLDKRSAANVIYKEITGIDFWANVDMHKEVRVIMDYLLKICPTSESYAEGLQDKLISLWADHSPISIFNNLMDISSDPRLINEENRYEANALLDYLCYLTGDYFAGENSFRRWNQAATTGANMLQAHTPEMYISWLYSFDSADALYSAQDKYTYVFIDGDAEVQLIRDGKAIEALTRKNGDIDEPMGYYLDAVNGVISVLIPDDYQYSVEITALSDETLKITDVGYTAGRQAPEKTRVCHFEMSEGDKLSAEYNPGENSTYSMGCSYSGTEAYESREYLDTDSVISLERGNVFDITWRDYLILLMSVFAFILAVFSFQLAFLISRFRFHTRKQRGWIPKREKFHSLPILCGAAIFNLFMMEMSVYALFPESTDVVKMFKYLIGILTIIIALAGYMKKKDSLTRNILTAVTVLMIADVSMLHSVFLGAFLHCSAYLFLCYTYWLEEKPTRKQLIIGAVMCVICTIPVFIPEGHYGWMRFISVLYVWSSIMMITLSVLMPRTCINGSVTLFGGGILMILNTIWGGGVAGRVLSLGVYYAAVVTLASTGTTFNLPKLVPEGMAVEETIEDLK